MPESGDGKMLGAQRKSVPVRADEHTGVAVRCSGCGINWDGASLYQTGDVLRCPQCDGVMLP